MARELDDHQRRELAEFVNGLAEAAGYATSAEWARDAGYPAPNLSNLRNGKSGIDGFNLLRLMRAASRRAAQTAGVDAVVLDADGMPVIALEAKSAPRAAAAEVQALSAAERPRALALLEELARAVGALAEGQAEILVELERGQPERSAAERPAPVAPRAGRRRGSAQ